MLPSAVTDRLDESEYPKVLVNDSPEGTTDHLVRDGDALCSNAPMPSRFEKPWAIQTLSLDEYVYHRSLDDLDPGDRPDRICKRCWSALGSLKSDSGYTNTADSQTIAATRYRWKAKGYARKVWCDLLVPDDAPMTDLQRAISAALGLRDEFHGWAFCERSNYDTADIEILPSKMYGMSGFADEYDAAETLAGDALDIFGLNDGDRFYYVYDLATPSVTYGILNERGSSMEAQLADETPEATYGKVAVLTSNEKMPSRY
jgi:hypothetical protein